MVKSKAAQRATVKYQQRVYDRINVLFPKGWKEAIQSTGESVNGFIKQSVRERLASNGIIVYDRNENHGPED